MNRRLITVVTCLFLGGLLATAGAALADGWWVTGEGSASGSLGALSPLKVTDAKGGEGLLPGEKLILRVDIDNPNRVALDLVGVDIGDLKSDNDTCNESLADSRLRFDRTPDITVQPGSNDGIALGYVRLSSLLSNDCQGRDVSADVHITAAYGS